MLGYFRLVLKEKSKIKVILLHRIPQENERTVFTSNLKCDEEFFRSVYPIDGCIFPQSGEDIARVEKECGVRICGMNDWLDACEVQLDNALKSGAVALKSALVYVRSLHYKRVTRNEAEEDFNEIFRNRHMGLYLPHVFAIGERSQDYMMHFILRLA